jgi:CRP-like cAMP-binding protein
MASPSLADVESALLSNPLFEKLTEEQLTALAGEVWLEQIPAGSLIVREGDEADALYVVVEGGVNVTKADGQFLAYLGPAGFFGEMALFMNGTKRTANCVSNEDTTCAIIRKPVLDQFCSDLPEAGLTIYRAIIRTLAERLQSTSADLAFLMGVHVRPQSAIDKLVDSARESDNSKSEKPR